MKTEHILKKYDLVCNSILFKFLEKYFCDAETELEDIDADPVGGQIDGCYNIGDYYIGFDDMITCLRLKIPEKTFFAWYDHSLECAMEDKTYANLENYYLMTNDTLLCKGCDRDVCECGKTANEYCSGFDAVA